MNDTTHVLTCAVLFSSITSGKYSYTHKPREIRRSIRRRWDICTSLLVEPPYFARTSVLVKNRAPYHAYIGEQAHAFFPQPVESSSPCFLHRPCSRPLYRTHPFQLLKSSFPSLQVEPVPSTGRGERTTCPVCQHLVRRSLFFLFEVLT